MAALVAQFLQEELTLAGLNHRLSFAVVQTAYANGAATAFMKQRNIRVVMAATGVKFLHHEACKQDVGVYFEANGHGTVLFRESAVHALRSREHELVGLEAAAEAAAVAAQRSGDKPQQRQQRQRKGSEEAKKAAAHQQQRRRKALAVKRLLHVRQLVNQSYYVSAASSGAAAMCSVRQLVAARCLSTVISECTGISCSSSCSCTSTGSCNSAPAVVAAVAATVSVVKLLLIAYLTVFEGIQPLTVVFCLLRDCRSKRQAVGDAFSDVLLAEAILRLKGWGIQEWDALYTDLPSRQAKLTVADRHVVRCTTDETRAVSPPGLQARLLRASAAAAAAAGGACRCFVRPSGTEDAVRVYAEAPTQAAADALALTALQRQHALWLRVWPLKV
eukprot:9152-Heterococcus_DN1.PRE.6